jgi:hypothetical protein
MMTRIPELEAKKDVAIGKAKEAAVAVLAPS